MLQVSSLPLHFFFSNQVLDTPSSAFPHHLFFPLLSGTDLRYLCHPGSWPQVWILPPEMTPDSFLFPYSVHFPVSDSLHPWFSPCLGFITGQSDNCREDATRRHPRVVLGCQEGRTGLGTVTAQPLRCPLIHCLLSISGANTKGSLVVTP